MFSQLYMCESEKVPLNTLCAINTRGPSNGVTAGTHLHPTSVILELDFCTTNPHNAHTLLVLTEHRTQCHTIMKGHPTQLMHCWIFNWVTPCTQLKGDAIDNH
jgi:hypothetical protein